MSQCGLLRSDKTIHVFAVKHLKKLRCITCIICSYFCCCSCWSDPDAKLVPFQARNAAIANSYFVGSINRVGTEVFPNAFTSGDGKPQHADFGHFYGSSHFSAPDASCTPSLSRYRDGLMISDMDLNLCRQIKDKWAFRMTARYDMYTNLLSEYLKPDFKPQVIADPLINKRRP